VTVKASGVTVLTATQPGNANFQSAGSATQTLSVQAPAETFPFSEDFEQGDLARFMPINMSWVGGDFQLQLVADSFVSNRNQRMTFTAASPFACSVQPNLSLPSTNSWSIEATVNMPRDPGGDYHGVGFNIYRDIYGGGFAYPIDQLVFQYYTYQGNQVARSYWAAQDGRSGGVSMNTLSPTTLRLAMRYDHQTRQVTCLYQDPVQGTWQTNAVHSLVVNGTLGTAWGLDEKDQFRIGFFGESQNKDGTEDRDIWIDDISIQVDREPVFHLSGDLAGTVGTGVNYMVGVSGHQPVVVTGSNLPAGLSLSPGGMITGTPTVAGLGTASIVASNSYGTVTNSVPWSILKGSQTITFSPLADVTYGDPDFSLPATSSSGLPVRYSTTAQSIISINGNIVKVLSAGHATITASQEGDGNYEAASPVQQNLKINPRAVSSSQITLTAPASLEYDQTRKVFSASSSLTAVTNFVLRYKPLGDVSAGNTFAPDQAGSYTVTAEIWQANYTGTSSTNFTISPRPLYVRANATNKVYGENDPALTFIPTGLLSGEAGALGGSLTRQPGNNVGTYAILSNGLSVSPNYSLNFTPADFQIVPKPLAVTDFIFAAPASLTYDGKPKTFPQALISGLVAGRVEYSGRNATLYPANTLAPTAAGDYTITVTTTDSNYAGSGSTNFTVARATLVARAVDKTRIYGATNPVLDAAVSGFVNGENESVLKQSPSASTLADTSSPVGDYDITVGGGAADNYAFQYLPGKLTITPALVSPTAVTWVAPASLTYDGTPKAFLVNAGGVTNWTLGYSGRNTTLYPANSPAPTAAGEYRVIATAGGNYTGTFTNDSPSSGRRSSLLSVPWPTR